MACQGADSVLACRNADGLITAENSWETQPFDCRCPECFWLICPVGLTEADVTEWMRAAGLLAAQIATAFGLFAKTVGYKGPACKLPQMRPHEIVGRRRSTRGGLISNWKMG